MANEEVVVELGDGGTTEDDVQALMEAQLVSVMEEAASGPQAELAEPLNWWEVYARGPFQFGADYVPPLDLVDNPLLPHRIIQVGERASVYTTVLLNPWFPQPALSACDIITGFSAEIELNYVTSNVQTMQPVPDLSASFCLETYRNRCYYVHRFDFTPREPACIYEMNICARICDCDHIPIQPFAAFVRWIVDYDVDGLFAYQYAHYGFDRPIRFMVSDFEAGCAPCPD